MERVEREQQTAPSHQQRDQERGLSAKPRRHRGEEKHPEERPHLLQEPSHGFEACFLVFRDGFT